MATIKSTELNRIGDGPVATVFSGHHAGVPVALKVYPKRFDKRTLSAYHKEQAKITALRRVTSILPVDAVDELDTGLPALRMEMCGQSLAGLIDRYGPMAPADAVLLGRAIATALAAAHERGVVHGGISPHNVLFRTSGEPVLADFGVTLRHAFARDPLHAIEFLPPETLRTGELTESSDLYGLGAILHYALTARSPHPGRLGEQPGERVLRILGEPVPAINNQQVPIELSTLVARLLAADVRRRPNNTSMVAAQLGDMLPNPPQRTTTPDFDDDFDVPVHRQNHGFDDFSGQPVHRPARYQQSQWPPYPQPYHPPMPPPAQYPPPAPAAVAPQPRPSVAPPVLKPPPVRPQVAQKRQAPGSAPTSVAAKAKAPPPPRQPPAAPPTQVKQEAPAAPPTQVMPEGPAAPPVPPAPVAPETPPVQKAPKVEAQTPAAQVKSEPVAPVAAPIQATSRAEAPAPVTPPAPKVEAPPPRQAPVAPAQVKPEVQAPAVESQLAQRLRAPAAPPRQAEVSAPPVAPPVQPQRNVLGPVIPPVAGSAPVQQEPLEPSTTEVSWPMPPRPPDQDAMPEQGASERSTAMFFPPPVEERGRRIRYDLLAGAGLVLALLALIPLLFLRNDPEELRTTPQIPEVGPQRNGDVEIVLNEPVDLTNKVELSWRASIPKLNFAVVIAVEGQEDIEVRMAERNMTMTVNVRPGIQYCFLVQGIEASHEDDVYQSNSRGLRGATCNQ